jgi:hypothetical protein
VPARVLFVAGTTLFFVAGWICIVYSGSSIWGTYNMHMFGTKVSWLNSHLEDPESQIVIGSGADGDANSATATTSDTTAFDTQGSDVQEPTVQKEVSIDELKKRPQFVVLAFDGSRSIQMWERTLNFAEEMKAKGFPIHYTYFLNAVYFLDPAHRNLYQAPHQKAGVSNIGFASSKPDVLLRIKEVNRAIEDGHDIGSHNAGHFSGTLWSYDEWLGQFKLFNSIMFDLSKNDSDYTLHLEPRQMVGFRAPELGVNQHMYQALKDMGFTYDTSRVGKATNWPVKDQYGLWQFSLPTIYVKDMWTEKNRITIGMDYNFYMMQSGAKNTLKRGSLLWQRAYDSTLEAYKSYFYKNYTGNHAPVYVANHFSYWNDGLYWQVMRDFAEEVCVLPNVRCVSFKELEQYMESIQPKNG